MRNSPFWLVILGMMIILDIYVFQAIKFVSQSAGSRTKLIIYITYWSISIIAVLTLLLLPYLNLESWNKSFRAVLFAIIIALFFSKLIAAIFLLIDDIRRLLEWTANKVTSKPAAEDVYDGEKITRSNFLSWLGLVAGGGILASLMYGFSNKYNYRVRRVPLQFSNLPPAFKGLKVVQLSDIHSGSFSNRQAVQKGVEQVMQLKPDLILFTGDLINNKAEEMEQFQDIFNQLKAPMGIYSVLGNHDYGEYVKWNSVQERVDNFNQLKEVHRNLGWKLMLNENAIIEKDGEQIALLGVENWSAKARFPKYGDLNKAYSGTEQIPFKILLSHDPSHWDAQVVKDFSDIDLMLSGHTHGMQFGIDIPGLKWSPVQYVYKQWAGLYENRNQKLYVNRGFGFLGYPGRVGVLPEITLIQLS
jgi:uncharacterized protein